MPYVESRNEFVSRMGCGHVFIGSGNDVIQLFANGGQWKWDHGIEPPEEDSDEMRLLRFEYAREKLKRIVYDYRISTQNANMANMFYSSGSGPPADPAALEWLAKTAPKIEAQQQLVEELGEEMQSKLPSAPHVAAHDRRREERQQESAEMAQQLAALPRF